MPQRKFNQKRVLYWLIPFQEIKKFQSRINSATVTNVGDNIEDVGDEFVTRTQKSPQSPTSSSENMSAGLSV